MRAIALQKGDRRGRIFLAAPGAPFQEDLATDSMFEADDVERDELLRALFREQSVVTAHAHPGTDMDDVFHIYVQPLAGGERLFACAVVAQARLEAMLQEAPTVIEGFSLQVVESRQPTLNALRAAIETWAGRNYPDLGVPAFIVERWSEPVDIDSTPGLADGKNTSVQLREPDDVPIGSHKMPRVE